MTARVQPHAVAGADRTPVPKAGVTLYTFVTFREDEALALARYLDITEPLLDAVGASIIDRVRPEGSGRDEAVLIWSFPHLDAIESVMESEEYRRAIPFRNRAFRRFEQHIAQ